MNWSAKDVTWSLDRLLLRTGDARDVGRLKDHIAALEAEVAQARKTALDEAKAALASESMALVRVKACGAAFRAKVLLEREHQAIDALKSKPAQEPCRCECGCPLDVHHSRGGCAACGCTQFRPPLPVIAQPAEPCRCDFPEAGTCRIAEHAAVPVEMASEENGLLPKSRRREHEYGEEKRSQFGTLVAPCVRPACKAFRVKNRDGTRTAFKQSRSELAADEPGPCEAEP